jgi:pyrroline-5-carboxylate reductase
MATLNCTRFGFIGLGAMGGGMVSNLARQLGVESKIYVYDIVDALVEAKLSQHPNKIFKTESAKEVVELSVSNFCQRTTQKKEKRKKKRKKKLPGARCACRVNL